MIHCAHVKKLIAPISQRYGRWTVLEDLNIVEGQFSDDVHKGKGTKGNQQKTALGQAG